MNAYFWALMVLRYIQVSLIDELPLNGDNMDVNHQ